MLLKRTNKIKKELQLNFLSHLNWIHTCLLLLHPYKKRLKDFDCDSQRPGHTQILTKTRYSLLSINFFCEILLIISYFTDYPHTIYSMFIRLMKIIEYDTFYPFFFDSFSIHSYKKELGMGESIRLCWHIFLLEWPILWWESDWRLEVVG